MRNFSEKELSRLDDVNPNLANVVMHAAARVPIFVVCGHRGEDEQNLAFAQGFSKVKFPFGKHNKSVFPGFKSDAVDLCPYPIDWKDHSKFLEIFLQMKKSAAELGVKIRCGADFNGDGILTNDRFVDLPHYEMAAE